MNQDIKVRGSSGQITSRTVTHHYTGRLEEVYEMSRVVDERGSRMTGF